MLTVQTLHCVADVILVVYSSGTNYRIDSVPDCVGYAYNNSKYSIAVARSLQYLTVDTRSSEGIVVDSKATASANGLIDGIANGVAYYNIDYQVIKATCGTITQVLPVLTRQ